MATTATTTTYTTVSDPLTDKDRELLRHEAARILGELKDQVNALEFPPAFWIPQQQQQQEQSWQCQFLNHAGFLLVPQFSTAEECQAMKHYMQYLVDTQWNPDDNDNDDSKNNNKEDHYLDSFGTSLQENRERGDYFLDSADRIHFFAEPTALEEQPEQEHQEQEDKKESSSPSPSDPRRRRLKATFAGPNKIHALNKVGHALHRQNPMQEKGQPTSPFIEYCGSDKLGQLLVDTLQWRNPVVPQSMYIFKAAQHGGVVHAHQDSTFLFTTPHQSCIGLWLALDDATVDNGCLWVRPQSHREPLRKQIKRNVRYFGQDAIDARSNQIHIQQGQLEGAGDRDTMFVMESLLLHQNAESASTNNKNEDEFPNAQGTTTIAELLQRGFVPVECQAGDLLVFCGTLDHLSLPNHTVDQPRHTFQLHAIEGPPFAEWSKYNWLQYPPPLCNADHGGSDAPPLFVQLNK